MQRTIMRPLAALLNSSEVEYVLIDVDPDDGDKIVLIPDSSPLKSKGA